MRLKKGDKVKITTGKDKGREGVVERVYPKSGKVLIPTINIYKKHIKKNEKMPQGGVVELPRPILSSKVIFLCPKCAKMTRIGYRFEKDNKYRICQKCESKI